MQIDQNQFVDIVAYVQADTVQTAFSVRHAMKLLAPANGFTGDIEAAAREYEERYGIRLWDGEGPKPGWVEDDEALQAQVAAEAAQ